MTVSSLSTTFGLPTRPASSVSSTPRPGKAPPWNRNIHGRLADFPISSPFPIRASSEGGTVPTLSCKTPTTTRSLATPRAMTAFNWTKPSLGLIEFNGSKDNNIVWTEPGINLAPFKDANPDAKPEEQYKAFIRVKRVMLALSSPDGLRWQMMREEPILTEYPFDTLNIRLLGHVAQGNTWGTSAVSLGRGHERLLHRRSMDSPQHVDGLFELVDRWRTSTAATRPGNTSTRIRASSYDRAPGTYLMFPSRFVHDRIPNPDWTYDTGVSDIVFMSSRDGFTFDRSFMEAFIRPGLDFNNWHDRGIYFEVGILQTSDTEMTMYGMENAHLPTQRIRRYTLRTDGFVSVNSGFRGGEFTTQSLHLHRRGSLS